MTSEHIDANFNISSLLRSLQNFVCLQTTLRQISSVAMRRSDVNGSWGIYYPGRYKHETKDGYRKKVAIPRFLKNIPTSYSFSMICLTISSFIPFVAMPFFLTTPICVFISGSETIILLTLGLVKDFEIRLVVLISISSSLSP